MLCVCARARSLESVVLHFLRILKMDSTDKSLNYAYVVILHVTFSLEKVMNPLLLNHNERQEMNWIKHISYFLFYCLRSILANSTDILFVL